VRLCGAGRTAPQFLTWELDCCIINIIIIIIIIISIIIINGHSFHIEEKQAYEITMFSVFPFHQLYQLTEIHKTWYERYATEASPSVVTNTNLENARSYKVKAIFN
jgi:hypothetical protein